DAAGGSVRRHEPVRLRDVSKVTLNLARCMLIALFSWLVLAGGLVHVHAKSVTLVPPGNRNAEQPPVPGASARRTQALRTTYEEKYRRIHGLFARDAKLRQQMVRTARQYGIDPLHIAGAIAGEHTYNVDAYDRLQA